MSEKEIEKTEKSFDIRSYHPGDEDAICALFEHVFGKPMGATESIRHWRWEFLENPLKEIFIKLAWDKERLIGQHAASAVRIYADGRDIIAALCHDIMTVPHYSRQGVFRNTAERLYVVQEKAGHGFIYGFPNRNSIHGFERNLNWRQIMCAPVHIRPINCTKYIFKRLRKRERGFLATTDTIALCGKASIFPQKSDACELNFESEFGDWADDLWLRCRHQHRLWVIRDKSYLNWRYVARPESRYVIVSVWHGTTPVGYAVTDLVNKEFGPTLFVLDFMADLNFKDAAETLIRYIVKLARDSGALFASALLPPGSKYRSLFRRHLFMPLPERLFPQPLYFGARCFIPALNDIVFNPEAWSMSWGDNDVL